jgi:hypothetical protein
LPSAHVLTIKQLVKQLGLFEAWEIIHANGREANMLSSSKAILGYAPFLTDQSFG